ncbi:MAG: class I SAM-dependent methyltransferase, partial [Planctomycetaceae bacterium]|nr:class I SAM-dependent methyltransferase [Planctomycetaceae bacterium]
RPHLSAPENLMGVLGTFHVVRCVNCRHLFMNPRPTLETLAACYPAGYGPHRPQNENSASPTSPEGEEKVAAPSAPQKTPWYLRPSVRSIPGLKRLYHWLTDTRSQILPPPPNADARALELGCGTGQFLDSLRSVGWNCEGVELVAAAAEGARRRGFPIHEGTLESAAFPDETFDAAFAWHVLEHLPDVRASLQELYRVLKPGGILAVSLPNVGCWEPIVFGRNWYVWELPRHLHFFNPARLRRLLNETGFVDVKVTHQRNLLNVVGSSAICLKRVSPRSRFAARLLDYPNEPKLWGQLAMAPFAIGLAWLHQGGRLTVTARRGDSSTAGKKL